MPEHTASIRQICADGQGFYALYSGQLPVLHRLGKKANILTIPELTQYSESGLMQIRNFGRKSLTEVREKLVQLGTTLKGGTTVILDDEEGDDEETD